MSSGLERSSQSVRPSRLTPGKMNRAAMDAIYALKARLAEPRDK